MKMTMMEPALTPVAKKNKVIEKMRQIILFILYYVSISIWRNDNNDKKKRNLSKIRLMMTRTTFFSLLLLYFYFLFY